MACSNTGLARRERESREAYRAWLLAGGGSLDSSTLPHQPPHPSDRHTFFAFAQLAAFRLHARRAVISLVDREWQHILAEASHSIPPAHDAATAERELLFGITSLPLADAFLDHAILDDHVPGSAPLDHFVSHDCRQDPRFLEHALVNKEGGVRFAAGVTLTSSKTGTIGTLVVLDNSPRDSVPHEDIEALRQYAKCTVRHLDLVRQTTDPTREVSVLRGIVGSFMDLYKPVHHKQNGSGALRDTMTKSEEDDENAKSRERTTSKSGHGEENGSDESTEHHQRPHSMEAALAAAFNGTATVLRQCSFADGAIIFGLRDIVGLVTTEGSSATRRDDGEGLSGLLASSLQNNVPCAAIDNGTSPSLNTLRRLASIYPRGMAFNVKSNPANQPLGSHDISANSYAALAMDNSITVDREQGDDQGRLIEETIKIFGEAQTIIFLPVYDQHDGALMACCFLWDVSGIRMASSNQDVVEYRSLGNFLSHNVAQVRMEAKDIEQDRFIANFSHELRSPIHGILGSAQFLRDTIINDYQAALLEAIAVSSNTLLDTLNVVLDYTKFQQRVHKRTSQTIHELSGPVTPAPDEPVFATSDCDLALLVEDACETMVAGHFFDNLAGPAENEEEKNSQLSNRDKRGTTQDVKVILRLLPRPSWNVRTSPGSLSRIMINTVGNALKFTQTGNIIVSLLPNEEDEESINVRIQVRDTGIGMSKNFAKNQLFTPYHQENRFSPGVGLGLTVVKQMVTSLHGNLDVESRQNEGTTVNIDLALSKAQGPEKGIPEDLKENLARLKGKHLVLLDLYEMYNGNEPSESAVNREDGLRSVAENWLQMKVSKTSDINTASADFFLFSEPPPAEDLLAHHGHSADIHSSNLEIPLLIVTTDSREAHMINLNHAVSLEKTGRIVQVLSQPCGPRKLSKVLNLCLDRAEQSKKERKREREQGKARRSIKDGGRKPSEAEPDVARDQDGNIEDGEHLSTVSSPPRVTSKPNKKESASKLSNTVKEKGKSKHDDTQENKQGDKQDDQKGGKQDGSFHDQANDCTQNKKQEQQRPASIQSEPPFSKPLVLSRGPADTSKTTGVDKKKGLCGLLVDDNKINLRLLVTLMVKIGCSYEQAENGQEALDKFKYRSETGRKFDFVCMDIGMPLMNGLESTRAMRAHEKDNDLPPAYIVACTAWGEAQTQDEARKAGMDAFLAKPLKFALLKDMLADVARR